MAGIRQVPKSPRWQATFRAGGKQFTRATSVLIPTDGRERSMVRSRRRATAEAEEMEKEARRRAEEGQGADDAAPGTYRAMVDRILTEAVNRPHPPAENTLRAYRSALASFGDFAGWDTKLTQVRPRHATGWVDSMEREGYAPATIDQRRGIVKTAFAQAEAMGWVASTPWQREVPQLGSRTASRAAHRERRTLQRAEFTLGELQQLLAVANREWSIAILLGSLLGLRLGDATSVRWEDIDFVAGAIRITAQKTQKELILPMPKPLAEKLAATPSEERHGPVTPGLAKRATSSLSRAFTGLVRKAGIEVAVHEGKRRATDKSFHALRHSAASLLAGAGVDREVRMAILGHHSEAVHEGYVHRDTAQLAAAVDRVELIPG
jgi:integrase